MSASGAEDRGSRPQRALHERSAPQMCVDRRRKSRRGTPCDVSWTAGSVVGHHPTHADERHGERSARGDPALGGLPGRLSPSQVPLPGRRRRRTSQATMAAQSAGRFRVLWIGRPTPSSDGGWHEARLGDACTRVLASQPAIVGKDAKFAAEVDVPHVGRRARA